MSKEKKIAITLLIIAGVLILIAIPIVVILIGSTITMTSGTEGIFTRDNSKNENQIQNTSSTYVNQVSIDNNYTSNTTKNTNKNTSKDTSNETVFQKANSNATLTKIYSAKDSIRMATLEIEASNYDMETGIKIETFTEETAKQKIKEKLKSNGSGITIDTDGIVSLDGNIVENEDGVALKVEITIESNGTIKTEYNL